MRKLIILAGNSPRNHAWGEACEKHFQPWFDQSYLQQYDHWKTGEQWISFDAELAKLKQRVEADGPNVRRYIFAKSIGSILALLAIDQGKVQPAGCVFFGMPLDYAAGRVIDHDWDALVELSVPTLAFHNNNDPTAAYAFTRDTLAAKAPQVTLITREADDHSYDEFAQFEPHIHELLKT